MDGFCRFYALRTDARPLTRRLSRLLESQLGRSVISSAKAADYLPEPPTQIEDVEPNIENEE